MPLADRKKRTDAIKQADNANCIAENLRNIILGNIIFIHSMSEIKKETKRTHLINLFKWRSWTALIACLVTLTLTSGSVIYALKTDSVELVRTQFEWFTVDSNLFMVLAAMMIIPFVIEGIQKKRLTYPKWAQRIHYAGVINMTMTLVFVLCFISWYDPELAFGEENLILHIICPLLVLISFFMVESSHPLTRLDNLYSLVPFMIYAVLYLINVVILGRWDDHYMLNTFLPFYVSAPLTIALAYIIGFVIRVVHNRLLRYRESKMKRIWDQDLDPVSVKIEIYSLGTHGGLHEEKDSMTVPYDILEQVSKRFNIRLEELSTAYNKGIIDGMKQKENERED